MRGFCGSGTITNLCGGQSQGYRVFGPQIDLGPTYTGNVYNSGNTTLATAPASCHLNTTNFMDLSYKIVNDSITMSYFPNGFASPSTRITCTTLKLTNAQHVAATSPGLIALQYETVKVSQFKNIKIRNMDGVGGGTAINGALQSQSRYAVEGGRNSLLIRVPVPGKYSVEVMDLSGKTIRSVRGEGGPVAEQRLALAKSGMFIVRISSAKNTVLQKVYVH